MGKSGFNIYITQTLYICIQINQFKNINNPVFTTYRGYIHVWRPGKPPSAFPQFIGVSQGKGRALIQGRTRNLGLLSFVMQVPLERWLLLLAFFISKY